MKIICKEVVTETRHRQLLTWPAAGVSAMRHLQRLILLRYKLVLCGMLFPLKAYSFTINI